jgi:hypothetical protein
MKMARPGPLPRVDGGDGTAAALDVAGGGEENSVFLALFEEALRDAALRKLFLDSYHDILEKTAEALVGAARPGGEALSADEADGIAYLLLCAAVGNAHLSSTGISPARASRLGAYCRKALALLIR